VKIKAAAAVLAKTKKDAAVRQKEEREWKDEIGPVLKEEFLKFGNDAVKPGYDYYLALYSTFGGELYEVKRAYHAGSVFDPLKLKSMSVETIELLIDDLVCFGFPEFTDEFLKGMKKELPLVIEHAHKPFDFGSVPGAAEYDASLARRLKLKEAAAAKGGGGGGKVGEGALPLPPRRPPPRLQLRCLRCLWLPMTTMLWTPLFELLHGSLTQTSGRTTRRKRRAGSGSGW
jgi:hypothetical protein